MRLAQEPSLAFAPATLAAFDPGNEDRAPRLTEYFLGLFGPHGPLPVHLTEYARDRLRNHGDRTFARFADLFHHRMLGLFYRAWADTQPTVSFDRPETDRFNVYVGPSSGWECPRCGTETLCRIWPSSITRADWPVRPVILKVWR